MILLAQLKMPVKACVATRNKMICLLQLKRTFLNVIEGVTIQEQISSENVLFCVIQVDFVIFNIV